MAGLSEEIRLKQLSKRSRNSQTPMMLNYEMKQTRQTLRKGNLFRTVKDDVLTKFVDMTNMMTFKRGSTIIKQGYVFQKRKRACIAYMESTCSLTFLYLFPPSHLFHCVCLVPLYSKNTQTSHFFNPINIF